MKVIRERKCKFPNPATFLMLQNLPCKIKYGPTLERMEEHIWTIMLIIIKHYFIEENIKHFYQKSTMVYKSM